MEPLIIGTRDSELALWQARKIKSELELNGIRCTLYPVKSSGDLNLDLPLYEMGITGIFTKNLDLALIEGKIDIAVHSMKDVPTSLPKTIVKAAVPKRANPYDILVYKNTEFDSPTSYQVATGSLRRKSQWLHRYPEHSIYNIRGNVNTRLQKLEDSNLQASIFAAAGLERIKKRPKNSLVLDWMTPAPAQGAMLVVTREDKTQVIESLKPLNDKETEICVYIERSFLKTLEGGCTAPIGALAVIKKRKIYFEGVLLSLDGSKKLSVQKSCTIDNYVEFGKLCAQDILRKGGSEIMEDIKKNLS